MPGASVFEYQPPSADGGQQGEIETGEYPSVSV